MEAVFVAVAVLNIVADILRANVTILGSLINILSFVYLTYFGVLIVREYRKWPSREIVLIATGFVVVFLFVAFEFSKSILDYGVLIDLWPQYEKLIKRTDAYSYETWGLLVFIIYMVLDVTLRIQNQLRAYARELELKNRVLEGTNVAYSRFVPKQFLSHLNRENIIEVKLGDNAQRTMTVLFSDIRSFTSISEKMSPDETFRFINEYLGVMEPIKEKQRKQWAVIIIHSVYDLLTFVAPF